MEILQKHLAESEKKFNREHGMLIETLAALQNLALRPSEAVLVQPLSPVDVMRSSILLRGSAHALEGRAQIIRQSIEDISRQKDEIAGRLADIEKENKELEKQQADMKVLSKQKSEMYSKLSTQSKEAQEKAKALASQANNLRDLVAKLEKQKELQQKQMAEKSRLARERATEELRAANRPDYAPQSQEPTGFGKAKGRLSRPARGPVVTKFHAEMSKGVISNGIDIKTVSKAQVIAPYDGTVIFAGPFKNFANLLIIDHGEGYTSLLSGLAETDASVGQMLLAGEPVGTMPAGDNVKLHMEIRKKNRPVDPNEWLSK
ncbi:MAG: peptidoglycan DD-metalloendopeptidase family protein [Alphaproteobacteria bacterium]|nr:peptidoglycan DD-metalloendopeptidase family protein [Alphaproteobacteria bacterium]